MGQAGALRDDDSRPRTVNRRPGRAACSHSAVAPCWPTAARSMFGIGRTALMTTATRGPNQPPTGTAPTRKLWPRGPLRGRPGQHRADVVSESGHAIELQHSPISTEDIAKRERHYGPRMYWLFDVRQAYETGRFNIRRHKEDEYITFRWKHARRSVLSNRQTQRGHQAGVSRERSFSRQSNF
jgi:hypothetical protein